MSHPSQFGPPPQQSGGGGTSVLVIVLIVLGVLFVVCGGLCAGCVFVARKASVEIGKGLEEGLKSLQLAAAFAEAQEAVASNQQVIDRLGEPIEPAPAVPPFRHEGKGKLNKSGETIQFDVKGPKGTGIVSVVATADGDLFHPAKITVTFSDGSVVDVPVKPAEPPAEAKPDEVEAK
jgi:Cytochrome oxidase complex assembly protein 1